MKKVDVAVAIPYATTVKGEDTGGLTALHWIYKNEKILRRNPFLHQPYGPNKVKSTSYGSAVLEARKMANYLISRGLHPGDHVGILSESCDKCVIAEIAIWMAGCTTVSLYSENNAATLAQCLQSTNVKFLFVGKVPLYEALEAGLTDIPKVAFPLAPHRAKISSASWENIIRHGAPIKGNPLRSRNDLAMIVFTQGTAGKQKAVMHAFGPTYEAASGIISSHRVHFNKRTRMLCTLPLASVFGRSYIEMTALIAGCQIFFVESPAEFQKDAQKAASTVYIAPPSVFAVYYDAVTQELGDNAKLNKFLKIPWLGKVLKQQILKVLGLPVTGLTLCVADTLSVDTLAWFKKLGLDIYQCYGTTEDFGYAHCEQKKYMKPLYSGVPYPGVRVKIDPENSEVLIDSPGKFAGYYNAPEMTRQCMDSDGFCRTGDRVQRSPEGMLLVQGRIGTSFTTAKGKSIAPESLEQILCNSPIVQNACVSGHGLPQPFAQVVLTHKMNEQLFEASPYAVAQVIEVVVDLDVKGVPTKSAATETAVEATVVHEERNVVGTGSSVKDGNLMREVEKQLGDLLHHVNTQVEWHEQLHFIVVISDPWTANNGCLTPLGTIIRSEIHEQAADRIKGWVVQDKKVIWA